MTRQNCINSNKPRAHDYEISGFRILVLDNERFLFQLTKVRVHMFHGLEFKFGHVKSLRFFCFKDYLIQKPVFC